MTAAGTSRPIVWRWFNRRFWREADTHGRVVSARDTARARRRGDRM